MSEEIARRLLKIYSDSNPHFEFHVVEGGHHVHINEPQRVAPLIVKFLEMNFDQAKDEAEAEAEALQSTVKE